MGVNQSGRYSKQYILAPVSAQAQLKRDRSERPLKSGDSPRIVCDLCLEDVPLVLVDVSPFFVVVDLNCSLENKLGLFETL